jgi:hypothetical protein
MTLQEARALFFARSGLGDDGGYSDRWVRIEMKPFPVYFPNTASRVRSAKLHDLHHLALEYKTDWPGEVEIAGWEIASGCARHPWAWLLNLGAFAVGMLLFPKRLYRAFLRGRHSANLYREGFPEAELPNRTVGWLRRRLRADRGDRETSPSDKMAFAWWCFIAVVYHAAYAIAGLAILWWIVKRLL